MHTMRIYCVPSLTWLNAERRLWVLMAVGPTLTFFAGLLNFLAYTSTRVGNHWGSFKRDLSGYYKGSVGVFRGLWGLGF